MNQEEIRGEVIQYWMNKAAEALASAKSEQNAGGVLLQSTELIMPVFIRQVLFLCVWAKDSKNIPESELLFRNL